MRLLVNAGVLLLSSGVLAMEALHRQVLPFLLRRMKEDVLQDLPPKIIQDYYCNLSPLQVTPSSSLFGLSFHLLFFFPVPPYPVCNPNLAPLSVCRFSCTKTLPSHEPRSVWRTPYPQPRSKRWRSPS